VFHICSSLETPYSGVLSVITDSINLVLYRLCNLWTFVCGFERYESTSLLVDKILETCRPVSFRQVPPSKLFAVVDLDSFDILGEQTPAIIDDSIPGSEQEELDDETKFAVATYAVDGKATRASHAHCTYFPQAGSCFCKIHHDGVVRILATFIRSDLTGKSSWPYQSNALLK
jgi:hypothetical protein